MCGTNENWSMIIQPKRKLLELNLRDIIRYRDLIFLFVRRDFVLQYKQTILGPLWLVINPLFSTIIYTFIFGRLANIGTNGIPFLLFYYSGTMLWTFFAGCFTDASNVFVTNANLFGKVYFPRLTVPISNVFTNMMKVAVQFIMLIVFLAYYLFKGAAISPSPLAAIFPLIFIWLAAIGMGAGIIFSALTTKYRDLRQLILFALNLAMYATPVVYPLSEIPRSFSWLKYANPVSAPIELFRICFFGSGNVSNGMILSSLGITVGLIFSGLILFNQNEQYFVDVI
jgi:lipopolysaccharide transport system permease protein